MGLQIIGCAISLTCIAPICFALMVLVSCQSFQGCNWTADKGSLSSGSWTNTLRQTFREKSNQPSTLSVKPAFLVIDFDRLLIEDVSLGEPIPRLASFAEKGFVWGDGHSITRTDSNGASITINWQFEHVSSLTVWNGLIQEEDEIGKLVKLKKGGQYLCVSGSWSVQDVTNHFGQPFWIWREPRERDGREFLFYEFPGDQEAIFTFIPKDMNNMKRGFGVESIEIRRMPWLAIPEKTWYGFTQEWSSVSWKTHFEYPPCKNLPSSSPTNSPSTPP